MRDRMHSDERATVDAAYTAALRAIVITEGRKRPPTMDEVRRELPPGHSINWLRLGLIMVGLHRVHGVRPY